MAMSSVTNFTVQNNVLLGNTSFIGVRGPNCSSSDTTPSPAAFVIDMSTVSKSTTQFDFASVSDGNNLICVEPPNGGAYWPFGGVPNSTSSPVSPPEAAPTASSSTSSSAGKTAGIVIGTILAVLLLAAATWYVRRRAIKRSMLARYPRPVRDSYNYVRHGG